MKTSIFQRVAFGLACALLLVLSGCDNNPYPAADSKEKILYTSFREAPRTLDPAVAYTTSSHQFTGVIYPTMLEYHYLKRPYQLTSSLAKSVPSAEVLPNGHVRYRFEMREGAMFQKDVCFEKLAGVEHREIVATDVVFQLKRVADPTINSPVISVFSKIAGFEEFTEALTKAREADPSLLSRRITEQYEAAGDIDGLKTPTRHTLEVTLKEPYPQILYWFAMQFTSPVPWEAVEYYDGQEGRAHLRDHPVGGGPYRLAVYDKQFRVVLERNPDWWGADPAHIGAPGTVYPSEGEPGDEARGALNPDYVGRPVPFIGRVEFRREKEAIPNFGKFLQGYYDYSGIIQESFDQVIKNDQLSEEMVEQGVRLEKTVSPDIFYIGFNMDDPKVGHAAGERGRKLRQAMSLAVDMEEFKRIFTNGRGVLAYSPIPPGVYGYEEEFENPFRQLDREKAKQLLEEAGYPGGINPETGQPVRLTYDTSNTTSRGLLQSQFFVDAWRTIGIDVEIAATNYNQFQEKVRNGAYQIFTWGWVADYPDAENFLFLLESGQARSVSDGPNTANFQNARYDALFKQMKSRENDETRLKVIRQMKDILVEERPWIEMFSRENYILYHGWMKNVKPFGMSVPFYKYWDIDADLRAENRAAWNKPILWPIYVIIALFVAVLVPGIRTFYRERQ